MIQTINHILPEFTDKFRTFPRRFFHLFGLDEYFLANGTAKCYEVNGKSPNIEAHVNLDKSLPYVDIYP